MGGTASDTLRMTAGPRRWPVASIATSRAEPRCFGRQADLEAPMPTPFRALHMVLSRVARIGPEERRRMAAKPGVEI